MRTLPACCLATLASVLLSTPVLAGPEPCHVVHGKSSDFQWCENRITRMTDAERVARLMPEPITPSGTTTSQPPPAYRDLPHGSPSDPTFDWHDVGGDDWMTGVRDQASCGSCFVFGAFGALESQLKVATGNPWIDVDLSEQSVISCISLGSCDSGGTAEEVGIRLQSEGATDEACYPYLADDGSCDDLCSDWKDRRFRIDGWHMSVLPWSEADIKEQLVLTPMIAQMQVYTDFYGYKSGVYSRSDSAEADGWHVVALVGWDDTDNSWIARNSWGDDWGDGGYFKVARDTDCNLVLQGLCFALHVNYLDVDPVKVPGMPCLNEREISLAAMEGEQDSADVEVSNCGQAWKVDVVWESDETWLTANVADPDLGVGNVTTASIVADAESLAPGTHQGKVRFLGGPGISTLNVTFEVEARPAPEPEPEPASVEPAPDAAVEAGSMPDAGEDDAGAPIAASPSGSSSEDDGCGCRAAGGAGTTGVGWLAAWLLAGWGARRRWTIGRRAAGDPANRTAARAR